VRAAQQRVGGCRRQAQQGGTAGPPRSSGKQCLLAALLAAAALVFLSSGSIGEPWAVIYAETLAQPATDRGSGAGLQGPGQDGDAQLLPALPRQVGLPKLTVVHMLAWFSSVARYQVSLSTP
jgi:hypothetical protein